MTFGIDDTDKIGVVGINGTGKSTLLAIAAGALAPDSGQVVKGRDVRISYLPQSPVFDGSISVLDNVEKDIEKRRASLLELQEQLKAQQESLGTPGMVSLPGSLVGSTVSVTTPTGWPARGEVSSPYGLRWNGSDFHPGIDIANDMGTPIVATADGTVTTAGWNAGGYGNMVDIDHGNGIMTRYGHAMQVVVSAGQHVRRGQIIAYMGSTGFSTGPHVHYEVRVNGQTVNPVSYL